MLDADAPRTLSAAELCRRCREETARFRRREPHDDRPCLDLIRRAVNERDDPCWQALTEVYGDQVAAWCRRAGGATADLDELVALAWAKFWQYFTPAKLAASAGAAGVLRYLQMCAQSAALDLVRARPRELPLEWGVSHHAEGASRDHDPLAYRYPDPSPTPEEIVTARAAGAEVRAVIGSLLRGEREQVLVYLMYELGLRSAEVQAKRPDLFASVREVYATTRNVQDRLSRSAALRAWLAREQE